MGERQHSVDDADDRADEIEIDDDALEVAAGGLKSGGSSGEYSYNSPIYFQASSSEPIT